MSDGLSIVLPETFQYPRYFGGLWLDTRRNWSAQDLTLLTAASDMRLTPAMAANTLGRDPSALAWKARELKLRIPSDWARLLYNISKCVYCGRAGARTKSPDGMSHRKCFEKAHTQHTRRVAPIAIEYPYIVKPDDRYNDLIAVNRIVSRQIPGREDVCQDIMLALWESRLSLDELKNDPKAVRQFVKSFRKASFERSGYAESMDATIHCGDGNGKSKYEDARYQRTLANEDDKFIESALFDARNTPTFLNGLLEEMEGEEETTGVPAAFWMRAELL